MEELSRVGVNKIQFKWKKLIKPNRIINSAWFRQILVQVWRQFEGV